MEPWNPIVGESFGQEERLTVRLRGLIRAYPRSVGIVKEFLQNADDAGATILRVVWDEREHPRELLPDPRMAPLQGPALLFINDQVFRPADLDAIRRIGESSKATLGPKTGRFGLGFNTAYNVSDHPSFVSGGWAVAFDPHRRSVGRDGEGSGRRWDLADLWQFAPDWLQPFTAGGLAAGAPEHPATIFRLPARDAAMASSSEICDEPFEREHFEQMLRDLCESGDELLLFARNVLELVVERFDADGEHHELLRISTVDPAAVAASRAPGNAAVEGDIAENIAAWRIAAGELTQTTYRHVLAVRTPKLVEQRAWQIAAGLFVDAVGELLGLNEAMVRLHEKAIPWAGAAVRLEQREDGGVVVAAQRGKLYCTLPLADQPEGLPLHFNACFDLDSSRRRLSLDAAAYAEADQVRVAWNRALLRHALPQAAALAIAALVPAAAEASLGRFYALWPALVGAEAAWQELHAGLVARLAELPLIRTRAADEVAWGALMTSRLPPPLFGPDLQEALRDDGLRLPDPELPPRMIRAADAAGVQTRRYRPAELRDWLRCEEALGLPLPLAPRACLRERSHIVDLLQFCLSDRKDDIADLPLALTCDEQVRTFGRAGELFLADDQARRIFADDAAWFIDPGVQQHTRLQPCEPALLREMAAPQVVARLARRLQLQPGETLPWEADGEAPPNATWLALVLRYLTEKVPASQTAALASLALFPDPQGRLHCAAGGDLLIPGEDLERGLQAALAAVGVDLVAGGYEVVEAVRGFHARHPGPIAALTGPSLANRLRAAHDALARLPGEASERAALLDYLAAPRWLDRYGAAELAALRELPLLRTLEGGSACAGAPGVFLPGGFRPPALLEVAVLLVDTGPGGRWRAFIELLGVPEMGRSHYLGAVLIPAFAGLAPELQRAALLWLRDEVELTALAPELAALLRRTPLIRARDGGLRLAAELHADDEHGPLADPAATPDREFYRGDADRWHALFVWLGLGADPPPALLLRELDGLLARHADDPAGARAQLDALFVHVQRRWPGLAPADAEVLAAGLRARAWLPARVAAPAAGFVAPDDRLYRPGELYPPASLELVASQGPVFAAPVADLDPGLGAALGLRTPRSEAILAHLERLRERWAAEGHGGLEPVGVGTATAAIYAALGDPERALDPAQLAVLATRACVWDPQRLRFWLPAHAFASPVADLFGQLRGHVPGATDEQRRGLARLGRRDSPDAGDIVAAIAGFAITSGGEPLEPAELALTLRLLRRLHDLELPAELHARLLVPTRTGRLRPAAQVRVDDAPWYSARITDAALAFLHPRVGAELIDRLGLQRLSTTTREELAERPALSGDGDRQQFCHRLTTTIHHPAFAAGLARILVHQGAQPSGALDLLADLRIVAVDRLVTQLRIAGLPAPLGGEEVPVFADEDLSVVYVRGDQWDSLVVQISEAINRVLDSALRNLAHLEAILRTDPTDIVALLDHRRVPRLHVGATDEPAPGAPEPIAAHDPGGAPSLLTHERAAVVEAGGLVVAPEPDVVAAAIERALASERAAGRDPRVMGKQHPAYDLQVGRPGDPHARFIRVIGIDGAWDRVPVVLGAKHHNAARTFGANFWLYVVEHALAPAQAQVHRIQDPVSRVARFVFDHRWRVQSEQDHAGVDSHLGWYHQGPGGAPGVIEAVEAVGMFIWLRVRLADGTLERRFFKPGLDRLIAPERPALAADGARA